MTCDKFDFGCYFDWLGNEIYLVLLSIIDSVLQGIASILAAIPVPAFASNPASLVNAISADIWYFVSAFEFGYGMGAYGAALGLRFLIRRIPFIG